ncbi:hypothetical protein [Streptomyces sp. ISL-100]|nr:hypothetical protein [Streptomyces sp. ISL-100]MBT2397669.1 hypothetical protein [Streptomyces sp. ISL-100]
MDAAHGGIRSPSGIRTTRTTLGRRILFQRVPEMKTVKQTDPESNEFCAH